MKQLTSLRPGEEKVRAAHWGGVPTWRIEAARLGTNSRCVECGATPLDGGLRCGPCFTACSLGRERRGAQHRSAA